jgi:CRISPR system Cascade subunit CasB
MPKEVAMQRTAPIRQRGPDFVALYDRFKKLGKGPQAELRRVATLERVSDLPAYYRWLGGVPPSGRLERIAFLMPFASHNAAAEPLGRQLFKKQVREIRLFQMLRSEPPVDIEHLRRLLKYLQEPDLDWQQFGRAIYFWGAHSKRAILQQYFTAEGTMNEPLEEPSDE